MTVEFPQTLNNFLLLFLYTAQALLDLLKNCSSVRSLRAITFFVVLFAHIHHIHTRRNGVLVKLGQLIVDIVLVLLLVNTAELYPAVLRIGDPVQPVPNTAAWMIAFERRMVGVMPGNEGGASTRDALNADVSSRRPCTCRYRHCLTSDSI